jgi:hypothetical protein
MALSDGWLSFRVASSAIASPANLIDANRPRGLTRDSREILKVASKVAT